MHNSWEATTANGAPSLREVVLINGVEIFLTQSVKSSGIMDRGAPGELAKAVYDSLFNANFKNCDLTRAFGSRIELYLKLLVAISLFIVSLDELLFNLLPTKPQLLDSKRSSSYKYKNCG